MWKDIPNYPGYQAAPDGRVRLAENEQILKPRKAVGKPYLQVYVRLGDKRVKRYVHQLVALTFIDKLPDQTEVHHIDGDPVNNRTDNLMWASKTTHLAIHN